MKETVSGPRRVDSTCDSEASTSSQEEKPQRFVIAVLGYHGGCGHYRTKVICYRNPSRNEKIEVRALE